MFVRLIGKEMNRECCLYLVRVVIWRMGILKGRFGFGVDT
jgi:hypothetical protein